MDIFDYLPPLSADAPANMEFGVGWMFTIGAVVLLNLYIAWHLLAARFQKRRTMKAVICILVQLALALPSLLYWIHFFGGKSDAGYMKYLAYYAGFYLCIFFYAAGLFFFWEAFRIIRRVYRRMRGKEKLPKFTGEKLFGRFGAVYSARITVLIVAVCAVFAASAFYAPQHIVMTNYQVQVDQRGSTLGQLKAVMFSDTHIGPAIREKELDEIVRKVMAEQADIILLAGDIFDEGTPDFLKEYASEAFSKLEAPCGVYFILGNHDDYKGDTEAVLSYITRAGITVLRDDVVRIGSGTDAFYLIGREDRPSDRTPLSKIEEEVTEDLPVLLLDHRPLVEELKKSEKVQIQISGHTHDGQIYPAHLVDPFHWTYSYGRFPLGNMQLYVSSGAGEFGVPMRLGSPAEIVTLDITFQ
jgi:predicted MPP superfamily phosphohydrolase